mgnify:CR=1 FL=1
MKATRYGFNPDYAQDEPTLDEVQALSGPAVLEFGAPWCGHCRAARASVEQALRDHPELLHIKIHDGKGKPLGRAFDVKRWPTLIFLQDGKEVERLVRPRTLDAVRQALEKITS